jgi:hypothetical protein
MRALIPPEKLFEAKLRILANGARKGRSSEIRSKEESRQLRLRQLEEYAKADHTTGSGHQMKFQEIEVTAKASDCKNCDANKFTRV